MMRHNGTHDSPARSALHLPSTSKPCAQQQLLWQRVKGLPLFMSAMRCTCLHHASMTDDAISAL